MAFGDFTYLQSLDTSEKNCNILRSPKILSLWTFFAQKVAQKRAVALGPIAETQFSHCLL